MRDLCLNQGGNVTTSDNFFKHMVLLSRDTNFNYRAEIAEAIGRMILFDEVENYKPYYQTFPRG